MEFGRMKRIQQTTFVLLATLLLGTGCAGLGGDWNKHLPWGDAEPRKDESKYQKPVRIVAIWSPAIYNRPGQTPTRGFGGRLYFYNAANDAIPVDGSLTVYAYDDSLGKAASNTPTRRFAFTAEQFKKHFSETEIGASYSVWVPWDDVGQPRIEIGLVPVFADAKGERVAGQQSRNFLPGPRDPDVQMKIETFNNTPVVIRNDRPPVPFTPQGETTATATQYAVQQTSYQTDPRGVPVEPAGPTAAVAPSLQTMSIDLPGSMSDRLARVAPQSPIMRRAVQPANIQSNFVASVPVIGQSPYPSAAQASEHALRNSAMSTEAREWMDRVPRPWTPPDPRQARYERPRSPVPSGPNPSPASDPLLSPPYPAGQPSLPPSSPQFGPPAALPGAW